MLFKGITRYFNERQKAREEKKALRQKMDVALPQAIQSGDAVAVKAIWDGIKDSAVSNGSFNYFLRLALEKDNLDIFNTFFSSVADQNYWLREIVSIGPDMPYSCYNEHILHAAIQARAETIALVLIGNQRVSVQAIGYDERNDYASSGESVQKTSHHASPIDLAHKLGMHAVEAALAIRISAIYEQKAVAAKQAAQKLKI